MNTKHPLYKEKLRLERESRKIYEIQRNQNWIDLEKPYISGYYKVWDLRDDIKNRDDAWVFYECMRLMGMSVWCRDNTFKVKTWKGKYEYLYAGFREYIGKETWESLHPAVRKHFIGHQHRSFWGLDTMRYYCTVPGYFFIEKITPRWITQYKELDCVLLQEDAELEDKLDEDKFRSFSWRSGRGPSKDFRKDYHRSDRNHNKQTLQRNMKSGGEDCDKYEYRYNHKNSATWDWW